MLLPLRNFNQPTLKIVVTDSGLGGLSVHALLDKHLSSYKNIPNIEIIFFNSVAQHNLGYNVMKTESRKLKVFNNALESMLNLNPVIILIACNTLSALYPKTNIFKTTNIPIISIIDLGIKMILENVSQSQYERIIIFGTETTIRSNKYELQLLEKQIDQNKIINQACKNLESEIQTNPDSNKVNGLIATYTSEALENINSNIERVIVVLACTHYGYSYNLFEEKLSEKFKGEIKILNPNEKMGRIIEIDKNNKSNSKSKIINKVISQVDINKSEMNNLSFLLKKDSPSVAEAFKNYSHNPNLFKID